MLELPAWAPDWLPEWALPAITAGGTIAILAAKNFAVVRFAARCIKWAAIRVWRGILSVIDLFRHRKRIDALEVSVAALQSALKPAVGPRTEPHFRIRWTLSGITGAPVPNCDRCFQEKGHLLELDARRQNNGEMWINCAACKSPVMSPKVADYDRARLEVLSRLKG